MQLFVIRDGNIVDRRELFWEKVGGLSARRTSSSEVLQRYYQDNLFIPPEILIPFDDRGRGAARASGSRTQAQRAR